ncbi:hypothetical protein [Pelagicoccus mobilis]|uniref:TonB-dependent receptor plug domain-containing protein n=1 Tax=Pelagicoccus mobilis TaxID=415221 RepID=A0A934RVE1_9BACT|nr:hypothetical protein [Pelagicoccus mobilis]MBK1875521.1 hypothetical protein [Pelagicoccus mobilis]
MKTTPWRSQIASNPLSGRFAATAFVSAASLLIAPLLSAQDEGEEIFELSPFTVDAGESTGYMTKSTTAGTRMRTETKDLGAQIDIFSKDFLDDIAASDPEEAFLYSINIENEQENPGYEDGKRAIFERSGPSSSTARGLGDPRTSGSERGRDFFGTSFRLHNYNTENLAISSGPNSILFGLGKSGATINASVKRAQVNSDFGSIGMKFDSHGTKAFNVDFNKVVIEDMLALRFAALDSTKESFLDGSYDKQDRIYGTLTFKPNDKANFRIHYEDIDEVDAPTQYRMFQDFFSPYFFDGNGELWDPTTDDDGNRPFYMNGGDGAGPFIYTGDNGVIDQSVVPFMRWNNGYGARGRDARDYMENVSDPNSQHYNPDSYWFEPNYDQNLDDREVTIGPDVMEALGLPLQDVNPWGDTMRRTREGDILTMFAEFNPLKDLYVEFGYNSEDNEGRQFGYNRSFNYGIGIDLQKYLPHSTADNLILNPSAGSFYMGDRGWGWQQNESEDEKRMTVSYSYNFREKEWVGDKWADLLGRHNIAYLYSDRRVTQIRGNSFQAWGQNSDGSTPSFLGGRATNIAPNVSYYNDKGQRSVSVRSYLTANNGYQAQVVDGWEPGAEILTLPDLGGTGDLRALMWSEEIGSNRLFSFDRTIDSDMIAYQGYFWGDRIILTYGKRDDDISQRVLEGAGVKGSNYSVADWEAGNVPPQAIEGGYFPWYTGLDWESEYPAGSVNSNETKGIVFRPNGIANWVSFFYNEATNNAAGTIRFDVDGDFHDPETGVGEDYGVRLDLLEGKLAFKINEYKTASTNGGTPGGQVDGNVRGIFKDFENFYYDVNPQNYVANGFDIFGQTDLFLPVVDRSAEGTEYTLNAQPTKNWNIRVTAAKTRSVLNNIATSYVDWGLERADYWSGIQWHEEDFDGAFKPIVDWWSPDDPREFEVVYGEDGVTPLTSAEKRIAAGFVRMDPSTTSGYVEDSNGNVVAYRTMMGEVGDTPLTGWDNVGRSEGNSETFHEEYVRRFLVNAKGRIDQLEGSSNPNVRKWRVNFSTSYQFEDGPMKGFRVGFSGRYRDAGIIGFDKKVVEEGGNSIVVADITKPYYNDDEFFFDAMMAYRGKFGGDKYRYRVQLNVRNLFDNSDLYPTDKISTGRAIKWAQFEPRTFILSTTLDF